jgi:transposase
VAAELDLSGLYQSLRTDGRGGASYDPEAILGILLYAYCIGERSSRRIEQLLCDNVAFRVVAVNQQPDDATVARFRRRHQDAIAEVFTQVLGLCIAEGLVQASVVAIDGTKIEANVSASSSLTRRQIADEISWRAGSQLVGAGSRERCRLPPRPVPPARPGSVVAKSTAIRTCDWPMISGSQQVPARKGWRGGLRGGGNGPSPDQLGVWDESLRGFTIRQSASHPRKSVHRSPVTRRRDAPK